MDEGKHGHEPYEPRRRIDLSSQDYQAKELAAEFGNVDSIEDGAFYASLSALFKHTGSLDEPSRDNILTKTKALHSKAPSFIGDKSINLSWKEVPKPAAPSCTTAATSCTPSKVSGRTGTTIISMCMNNWICSVSDGRSTHRETENIAGGKTQKLWGIKGGKYIGTAAGHVEFSKSVMKRIEDELRESKNVREIIKDIRKEARIWNSSEALRKIHDGYPAHIGLNGFHGDEALVLLVEGDGCKPFTVEVDENTTATIAFSGSGSLTAIKHFKSFIGRVQLQTPENVADFLKQCIAASACVNPHSGSRYQVGSLEKGGKVKIEKERPHLFQQIAKDFGILKPYFLCCLLYITSGVHSRSSKRVNELKLREYLRKLFDGVERISLLGAQLTDLNPKAVRLIRFRTVKARKEAMTAVEKDRKILVPTGGFPLEDETNTKAFKRELKTVRISIASQGGFERLSVEFQKDSW